MPSSSPGSQSTAAQETIHPGQPNESLQAATSFYFRHKHYAAYLTGRRLIVLSSPDTVVNIVTFSNPVRSVSSHLTSGKLVVAEDNDIFVLDPVTEGWTKIWWEKSLLLQRPDTADTTQCLSWTNEGEILVGGRKSLTLFSTHASRNASIAGSGASGDQVEQRRPLWSVPLPTPVNFAAVSPSANLIASSGVYDRLVKIWRRLSFEDVLFDYVYLPHRSVVTHLEWKPAKQDPLERRDSGVSSRHEEDPEVLITIAADCLLRLWKTGGNHDAEVLTLYATIDLVSSIPSSPSLTNHSQAKPPKQIRYMFVIPSDQFNETASRAIASCAGQTRHALEHLKEIVSNSPDIFVILDGNGRMSAWGVQSVGHRRRPETPFSGEAFHIAHAEDLPLRLPHNQYARFYPWIEGDQIQCLVHSFKDGLQWWQGSVEAFMSPSTPGNERFQRRGLLSGHADSALGISISSDRSRAVTWSRQGDARIWRRDHVGDIVPQASFGVAADVKATCISTTSSDITVFRPNHVTIYSERDGSEKAQVRHSLNFDKTFAVHSIVGGILIAQSNGHLSLLSLAQKIGDVKVKDVGKVDFDKDYKFEKISILSPNHSSRVVAIAGTDCQGRVAYCQFNFGDNEHLLPGTRQYCESRIVQPNLFHASDGIAALAASHTKTFGIIDPLEGYLEHEESVSDEIKSVVCFRYQHSQKGVALGYSDRIEIVTQRRYARHRSKATWEKHVAISVENLGTTIGPLEYFGRDKIGFGFANGIKTVSAISPGSDSSAGDGGHMIFGAEAKPIWHPEHVERLLQHLGIASALNVFERLNESLKFWTEGDEFPKLLNTPLETLFGSQISHRQSVDSDLSNSLLEQLAEKRLPHISSKGQDFLGLVFNAAIYVSTHAYGLDSPALSFLFTWKLHILQHEFENPPKESPKNGINGTKGSPRLFVPVMQWREIAFAYHSKTQQPLLDILILRYDNVMTWDIARNLGITAWLTDQEALRQVFESLAQSAYRSTTPADPINASLYFLALHKKATLLGLWRIATWHREQKATMNFLKRDFTLPESQTAAKKNAYALMGKRRFEYAAAFFLLAEDGASAVSMLAGQCDDVMLAVAVARLYGGTEGSPLLTKLISDRLIPLAESENNRWLMSWCHSMLGEAQQSAEALVRPLNGVKRWDQDDPDTLLLYRHIRRTTSPFEYAAVLRSARVLRRMGFLPLALHVVQSWSFLHDDHDSRKTQNPQTSQSNEAKQADSLVNGYADHEPEAQQNSVPSMLDGFMSDLSISDEKAAREAKAAELLRKIKAKKTGQGANGNIVKPKPPPTQFHEPDPNSLLDSFGF